MKNDSWKDITLEGVESHGDSVGGYWYGTLRNLHTIFEDKYGMCLPFYRGDQDITLYYSDGNGEVCFDITISSNFSIYSKLPPEYDKYKKDVENYVTAYFLFLHKMDELGYQVPFRGCKKAFHVEEKNTRKFIILAEVKYKKNDDYFCIRISDYDAPGNPIKYEFFFKDGCEVTDELKTSVLKGLLEG